MWFEGPGRPDFLETCVSFVDDRNFLTVIGSPDKSIDGKAFYQRIVRRDLWDVPAGKTDDDDPSFEIDATQGRLERIAADWVVDHIRAAVYFKTFSRISSIE